MSYQGNTEAESSEHAGVLPPDLVEWGVNYVLPLVEPLIRSVTEEENEIDALCSAVIAKDLDRAEGIAIALTTLRRPGKGPVP